MTPKSLFLSDLVQRNGEFPLSVSLNEVKSHFPLHRHDFIEISYVVNGSGTEIINGRPHCMQPGTFSLLMPYQLHEIYADSPSTISLYSCGIDMGILGGAHTSGLGLDIVFTHFGEGLPPFHHFEGEQIKSMRLMFDQMYAEVYGKGLWGNVLLRSKFLEILITFDRVRQASAGRIDDLDAAALTSHKRDVWKVIEYIHQHYQEDMTLSDLSARFHISAPYLSAILKRQIGETFLRFLNEVRIRNACSLLVSTDMNVSEIAMEVGYSTFSSFSRAFQDQKNMSPSAYRKLRALIPFEYIPTEP